MLSELGFGVFIAMGSHLILVSVNDLFFLTLNWTCSSSWSGLVSLTCVSVSMSEVATSKRLGLDRYLLSLNWFSSSSSCWLVKAVRGLRHFPNRPDWGPAGGGRADKLSICVSSCKWIGYIYSSSYFMTTSFLFDRFTQLFSGVFMFNTQCLNTFVII